MHETLVYVISIDFMIILYHKYEFKMLMTCCTYSYHDVIEVVWWNLKWKHDRNEVMLWSKLVIDVFSIIYVEYMFNHGYGKFSIMFRSDIMMIIIWSYWFSC